ncbi:hypothetical protein N7533_008655 [Penicillium manginii]|uniref:uncharacterized protein n=1 Tax=Penicillium manginii TaxID=203109 RepID=UPI0025490C3C|nr:uncharacterized protein N7533_008655 [Penicillium manginii]KAJ5743785.1 hypothetical protein N7533_008655 [Penicillium manginii]
MSAQNQQNSPEYPHFALIYIDRQGNLRHESSLSVANSRETILSPLVTDEFLRAVQRSSAATPSHSRFELGAPPTYHPVASGQTPVSTQIGNIQLGPERKAPEGQSRGPLVARPPTQPPLWSAPQGPGDWSRWSGQHPIPQPQQRPWGMEPNMRGNQTAFISIRDKDFLRRYYEKIFQNLQQTNCRVLAKAYVKLVEPRKQVNFPYNGRKIVAGQTQQLDPDDTKPPWWPTGVSHREPDHLPKAERIRLLVHILCELRTTYGITARKLKASDQPIRRQILPAERLEILDEVYQVREEEEKLLDGVTDGKAMVSISRSNLPDAAEALVNRGEQKQEPAPINEDPSPEPKTETMPVVGGPSRANPPTTYIRDRRRQPSQPTTHPESYSVKRKRQDSGPDVASTVSPTTMGYYSPIFVGSQPFMTEPYAGMQGFQASGVTSQNMAPGQPIPEHFREPMENYEFPYYFEN